MTAAEVLHLIAKAKFTKMTELARDFYAGVESDDAMVGTNFVIDDNEIQYTIILDGNRVCLIDEEGAESQYILGDNIFA